MARTLVGRVINPVSLDKIEYLERAAIYFNEAGDITAFEPSSSLPTTYDGILIPGLIDCHLHAPQWPNLGRGYNVPLLEWLDKYTFPREASYSDTQLAETVYEGMVRSLLAHGTTFACYFGSLQNPANKCLVQIMEKNGQRGFVGRVCMDCNTPSWYCDDSAETSWRETKAFIESIKDAKLVSPIITPRFAVSCTQRSLRLLGTLAKETGLPVQSHLAENLAEIDLVTSLFPDCEDYAHVYEEAGLLSHKTIMAHCIHLKETEIDRLVASNTAIAHCPSSNFNLSSGVAPIRKYLERGIRVGLGTDISGGSSPSILDAMRQAIIASKMVGDYKPLSFEEVFYLGTKGGGVALNRPELGHFAVGNPLDAIIWSLPPERGDDRNVALPDLLEMLVNSGDSAFIREVLVGGRRVK